LNFFNGEINLNSRLLSTKCWARVVESTSHQHIIIIIMGGWMMGGHKKNAFPFTLVPWLTTGGYLSF